jgi:phosphonate transport system substrate-binding protein
MQSGAHYKSLRMVAAGEVDASAIDSHVLGMEAEAHPDLVRQVKVIDTLGPSPVQPVVAAARLPDVLRAAMRAVLLAMADDPEARAVLAGGHIARFVTVTDADYDPIRAMLARAQAVRW